jgi:hypothetical protein
MLPDITISLIERTIDNLWEDGAEWHNELKAEGMPDSPELTKLLAYILYLEEVRFALWYNSK